MRDQKQEYDAIVVGSGAGGGIAAYVLTLQGLSVLVLEAGRNYDPVSETPMFQINADAPLNGAATPDKPAGFYDATVDGGFDIPGEPYTVAPGSRFQWWRARMLGGRTNHWSRITLRYGPRDFRTYSRRGVGVDWPIAYEDLASYYDRVERLIGVFGAAEGIENSPDSSPGILLPPPPMHAHELWMQMALGKKMGIRVVPSHVAVLTRPLNGRQACLYATPCARGCAIRANFQSPTVLLAPALTTGRLKIRHGAMAYEIPLSKNGRAAGVRYVDRTSGAQHFARGRSVVLAASTCESARILLNSRSAAFPQGLANSSGEVGHNLTDSPNFGVAGDIPVLQGLSPFNDDGTSISHAYVPWWGHQDQASGRIPFTGECYIEILGGRQMPAVENFGAVPMEGGKPLYGQALRDRLRNEYGSKLFLWTHGGMIPNADSRCEIDPDVKDRWGIPVLRFHWKWGAPEYEQTRYVTAILREMISTMGGRVTYAPGELLMDGGEAFHEVGTARMGSSPRDSVLNAFGHAWDVRNLYVADGAGFAGHACKNPTETIMALAWRACDHLAESLMRKEI